LTTTHSVTNTVLSVADTHLSFLLYEVKQVLEKVRNIIVAYEHSTESATVDIRTAKIAQLRHRAINQTRKT